MTLVVDSAALRLARSATIECLCNVLLLLLHTAALRPNRHHNCLHPPLLLALSVISDARILLASSFSPCNFYFFLMGSARLPVYAFSRNDEPATHTVIITTRKITRISLHTSPPSVSCFPLFPSQICFNTTAHDYRHKQMSRGAAN